LKKNSKRIVEGVWITRRVAMEIQPAIALALQMSTFTSWYPQTLLTRALHSIRNIGLFYSSPSIITVPTVGLNNIIIILEFRDPKTLHIEWSAALMI
jgi:hypothetical protein